MVFEQDESLEVSQTNIEYGINNKPLVGVLMQAGVLCSQIGLAYAGEPVLESA